MTTKPRIVKDFKDGLRSIDNCLELGFESNERVLSDLSNTSGNRIPRCSVSDLLRGKDD